MWRANIFKATKFSISILWTQGLKQKEGEKKAFNSTSIVNLHLLTVEKFKCNWSVAKLYTNYPSFTNSGLSGVNILFPSTFNVLKVIVECINLLPIPKKSLLLIILFQVVAYKWYWWLSFHHQKLSFTISTLSARWKIQNYSYLRQVALHCLHLCLNQGWPGAYVPNFQSQISTTEGDIE